MIRGTPGEQGQRGAPGKPATFSVYMVMSPCQGCEEGESEKTAEVSCDRGDVALGGGFISDGLIQGSRADDDGPVRSWSVAAIVEPEGSSGAQAQLVCQDLPPLRS